MKSTILAAMCCLLVLCACRDDKDDEPREVERAVLVYMACDNNLDSQVSGDLYEMTEGSKLLGDDCALVAFIDRQHEKPYIIEIAKGDTIRLETYDEEMDLSDTETLRMAMQWFTCRYQAKSYGLVLWGHADGWTIHDSHASEPSVRRAYGVDVTDGSQWMDITDMAEVLSDFPKLKFIFADCCAFMSVESMYELRRVADYIIGSPAEIPAEGAPYHTVVPMLFSQQPNFYQQIADAYFAQKTYDNHHEPMAVVRTSEMERLAAATKDMLASFVPMLPNPALPDVGGLIYYYKHTLFDMNDFFLLHADDEVYRMWRQVFDEAVVYTTYSPRWRARYVSFVDFEISEQRYGGLNMYVPQDPSSLYQNYAETAEMQASTISRMQWYQAAGLDKVGW